MEFLLPLRIVRYAPLLLAFAIAAPAKDFCSLTVRVTSPDGFKPTGLPVSLVESNGRVESGPTKEGEVRFCDLGISPVTVTVGGRDRCNEVVIHNIAVNWETERVLSVIYDHAYCNGDEVQNAGCLDLLRFVDEQGRSVAPVGFDPAVGVGRREQTDGFGRALIRLRLGDTAVFTAKSSGYKPEVVELTCGSATSKRETLITLHGEVRQAR